MSVRVGRILFLTIFVFAFYTGCAVHVETTNTSNSACFGSSGPISMTLSCDTGYVIAIDQIFVGAKHSSTGCPAAYDSTSNDTSCCSPSTNPADDCIFPFDHTNYNLYHTQCNGRDTCTVNVLNVLTALGSCDQTFFSATTSFGYINYVCVEATRLTSICATINTNVTGPYTYVTSDGFPGNMATSTSPCTCSVQADDPSATLQVVTIQRLLTGNSNVTCDQSLSLVDSDQNSLVTWTCDDNTYVEQTTAVTNDYVILNLTNDRTVTDGNFWVEVRATIQTANLMMDCPAQTLTTTTTASTTTATTTTMATTTAATTTTAPTTTTTAPITTTNVTNGHVSVTPSTDGKEENSFLIPFIVCAVLVLLSLAAVVTLAYCLCRRNKTRSDGENSKDLEGKSIFCDSDDKDRNSSKDHSVEIPPGPIEHTEAVVEAPEPPAAAFVGPVIIDEQPRGSENEANAKRNPDNEHEPVATSDKSVNTDHVVVTFDEKASQVTVDTSEQGCHAAVPTQAKDTNTLAPASMVHASIQTKQIRTKEKQTETIATVNETVETSYTQRERRQDAERMVNENQKDKTENTVDEKQPHKSEIEFTEPVSNEAFPIPEHNIPPSATSMEIKRLKRKGTSGKKKKKLINNFVVPAPEPVTIPTGEKVEYVEPARSRNSSPEPPANETNANVDNAEFHQNVNEIRSNDTTAGEVDTSGNEQKIDNDGEVNETKRARNESLDDPYTRLRKKMEKGFYKPEREGVHFEKSLKDMAKLRGRTKKKKNKAEKEEKHTVDSGIETNSQHSNSSDNVVAVSV